MLYKYHCNLMLPMQKNKTSLLPRLFVASS